MKFCFHVLGPCVPTPLNSITYLPLRTCPIQAGRGAQALCCGGCRSHISHFTARTRGLRAPPAGRGRDWGEKAPGRRSSVAAGSLLPCPSQHVESPILTCIILLRIEFVNSLLSPQGVSYGSHFPSQLSHQCLSSKHVCAVLRRNS